MKDRYLFRGKRVCEGEWIYGVPWEAINGTGGWYMRSPTGLDGRTVLADIKVDPATIGQCTGLRDKNGRLVFEGNVIKFATFDYNGTETQHKGVVYWCDGAFWIDCTDAEGDEGIYSLGVVAMEGVKMELIKQPAQA